MKNKVTVVRKTFPWILFFGTLIISVFSSCSQPEQQSESGDNPTIPQEDVFEVIYTNDNLKYYLVYDVETYVEYIVSNGPSNRGAFTVRVDSTGKPILYKH